MFALCYFSALGAVQLCNVLFTQWFDKLIRQHRGVWSVIKSPLWQSSKVPICKVKVKHTCIAPLVKLQLKALRYGSPGLPLQTTPYLPLPCERLPDGATWTADIWFSSLLIYRPRKDERLSWLTYSGRYTHTSVHTSATDRAEVRESSPVRDRRSNHSATQPTSRNTE